MTQEWIIKTVQIVSSKFECNATISKVVSKSMVSSGILKSGNVIRDYNTEKKLIGTAYQKEKNIKKTVRNNTVNRSRP